MPSIYPSFRSFSAGEISPRMYARSDLPMYRNAVGRMENFNITPQGSAIMRRGWRYLAPALSDDRVRLITFSRALNEDIVIELGLDGVRAYNSSGDITVDLGDILGPPIIRTHELVQDGSFGQGLAFWGAEWVATTASGVDDRPPTAVSGWYISNGYASTTTVYQYDYIRQTLTKPTTGTPVDDILKVSFQTKFDESVFPPRYTASPISPLWEATIYAANGTTVLSRIEGSDSGLQQFPDLNILAHQTLHIEVRAKYTPWTGGQPVSTGMQFTAVSAIYQTQEESAGEGEYPWTREQLPFIQTKMLTGQDTMILVERRTVPYLLKYDATTNRLELSQAIFAGAPPWVENDSVGVVEIFQGRLWLMSTLSDPSAIWGSKSGEPLDFTLGSAADDALYLPLATDGVIQWAVGQKRTISIGTDLGENVLSSDGPIITPSDASATRVSAYGSTAIQASMVGDQIMFVSPDARKLLVTNYDDNTQNWVATELTWPAQHLTQNFVLRFLDMRNPDYQIVCGTRDGYWIQALYDRTIGLLGWQRNTMTGQIISMCSTRSIDGDILWAAVKRANKITINRIESTVSPRIHLDYWARRFPEEDANGWFVDELEHLADTQVVGVVDGAVLENLYVNGTGVLRLPYEASDAVIGLPYKGRIVTLPEEPFGSEQETYSGGKQRNSKVTVRLIDSAMPLINGQRPADRSPQTPMGSREPNITQDIDVSSLGWDDLDTITIEQDKPLRTEIAGIFSKFNVNKT